MVGRKASQNAQHTQPWGRQATTAENTVCLISCQTTTGFWSYRATQVQFLPAWCWRACVYGQMDSIQSSVFIQLNVTLFWFQRKTRQLTYRIFPTCCVQCVYFTNLAAVAFEQLGWMCVATVLYMLHSYLTRCCFVSLSLFRGLCLCFSWAFRLGSI